MNTPLSGNSSIGVEGRTSIGNGALIINADDWGRDRANNENILYCAVRRGVTSVSAMVFMEASEEAAQLAREHRIDAGLHLNLTTPFSEANTSIRLRDQQLKIAAFLKQHPFARAVYHPGLKEAFKYVVTAQLEEFQRLYGKTAARIDGHHHMHLCANVLVGGLLPKRTVVRRYLSAGNGGKLVRNAVFRAYAGVVIGTSHPRVDYLFTIDPMEPSRLSRIFGLAKDHIVELETHPIEADEVRFLTEGELERWAKNLRLASFADVFKGEEAIAS